MMIGLIVVVYRQLTYLKYIRIDIYASYPFTGSGKCTNPQSPPDPRAVYELSNTNVYEPANLWLNQQPQATSSHVESFSSSAALTNLPHPQNLSLVVLILHAITYYIFKQIMFNE